MNKIKYYVDIGDKFGKLTVIGVSDDTPNKKTHYVCKCDCGNTKIVDKYNLIQGRTKSCGCLVIKHNDTKARLYAIWKNIKARCNNKNYKEYNVYGERGIKLCPEWEDYTVFKNWAINNGYKNYLTIDRIDGNKGYSPNNCRWISLTAQSKNRTGNHYFIYKNVIYNLKELSELLNIRYSSLYHHFIRYGNLNCYLCKNATYNDYVKQLNKEINEFIKA